eukprot:CAMPEP_0169263828 /NCGR_PEP_ID=MMETSP1016-20121227/44664_1 /TAXON_ID=342587 /ORGANISM="Karlodinium micrum, Strain CCMP2283" /LENGTH=56 /DNA_ID=CAMNT_0009346877 /DNA_START=405 /DNA_END=572 /DNA_ORIENTATION=-
MVCSALVAKSYLAASMAACWRSASSDAFKACSGQWCRLAMAMACTSTAWRDAAVLV